MEISYFGAALAGLLSFLSPCVLPLVPPYLCYLGGTTFDELSGEGESGLPDAVWRRVVLTAIIFVLGFTTVFVSLGAAATAFGQLISANFGILSTIAGIVIIILGLHFLGLFKIPFLYREARIQADTTPASLFGAYVIGLAFAFGWTPCIGPVLSAILAVAASEQTVWKGVSLLLVYSLGLGIPFILAAVAVGPFLGFLKKFRRHIGVVEKVMGGFLVVTGVLFLTGSMNLIATWMLEAFPSMQQIG